MPHLPTSPRRPWIPEKEKQTGRKNSNYEFYNSSAWRKNRGRYIRKYPLCVECQKEGITQAGQVVDHITPINEGGDPMAWSNLQTLCSTHHNQKSGRESAAAREREKEKESKNQFKK